MRLRPLKNLAAQAALQDRAGFLWDTQNGLYRNDGSHFTERCRAAGMDQFINKPLDAARFVETVGAAAGSGRVRDSEPSRLPL